MAKALAWLTDMMSRLGAMIRGLLERGTAAILPRSLHSRKGASALAAIRQAALRDPEAARFYLRQRVLIGDGPGAVEFYRDVVMSRSPDLVLDPVNQAALVRILELSGFRLPAVRACELFLLRYPAEPGWDSVALSLGRLLLQEGPAESLPDAIRHLARAESAAPEKRHRAEARRLRDALVVRAEAEGIGLALPSDQPELKPQADAESPLPQGKETYPETGQSGVPQGTQGLQIPVVSGPKKRSLRGNGPVVAPGGRRPPAEARPAGKAEAGPALEGRAPLPLRSAPAVATRLRNETIRVPAGESQGDSPDLAGGALLGLRRASRRTAGLMPFAPGTLPVTEENESVYGAPPPPEIPSAQVADPAESPPVGEGFYGVAAPVGSKSSVKTVTAELPGPLETPGSGKEKPVSQETRLVPSDDQQKRTTLPPPGEERRKKHSLPFALDEDSHSTSSLAAGGTPRIIGTRKPGEAGPGSGSKEDALYAVLVPSQDAAKMPEAEATTEPHVRDREGGRLIKGVPGLVVRQAPQSLAQAVAEALTAQGIEVRVVRDEHPLLHSTASETLSLQIEGDQVTAVTATSRITFAVCGVRLLKFSRMRLSSRSQSSQRVIEVIATQSGNAELVRLSLWERTCRAATCRVDGAPVPGDDPLGALYAALKGRVPAEALVPLPSGALLEEGAVVYGSFRDYDDALAAEILTRWGQTAAMDQAETAERANGANETV